MCRRKGKFITLYQLSVAILSYYFTLCTHKKTHLFSFLINVFWGADSKSAIHFFRPALENPDNDNSEKINFSGLSRFSGVVLKKWTSAFFSAGQKTLY